MIRSSNSFFGSFAVYASMLVRSDSELLKFVEQNTSRYEAAVKDYIRLWEEALVKNNEAHERNEPLIAEMNETIREVTAFMILKGFPQTYTVPKPGSRARIPPRVTIPAGYKQDIDRLFVRQDGHAESVRICNEHIARGQEILQKSKILLEQKSREERKKKEGDKKFFELIKINEELGSPIEDMFECSLKEAGDELIDYIRDKNDALSLALAMLDVRNDWNDGCGAVDCNMFTPTNKTEEEIIEDVSNAIERFSDCQDGRVFRDTKWSYDKILGYVAEVDPTTYALYARVSQIIDG